MTDIFLSYAREDAQTAKRLAGALADEGWLVWWDRYIPAGKTFDEVIQEKVTAARCVVVLWSKSSVKSKWVKIEAHAGANRGILIPAALITDMDALPLAFRFEQTASLVGWNGEKSHQGYQALIEAIAGLTGPPRRTRPRRPAPSPPPSLATGRRTPGTEAKAEAARLPIAKWKVAAAASALIAGAGLFMLVKSPSMPLSPGGTVPHRAKVVIQDYGEHYQLYRDNKLLGTTPYEFDADLGEKIQLECRGNGIHVQTLTFDVGNSNVWSCRE